MRIVTSNMMKKASNSRWLNIIPARTKYLIFLYIIIFSKCIEQLPGQNESSIMDSNNKEGLQISEDYPGILTYTNRGTGQLKEPLGGL